MEDFEIKSATLEELRAQAELHKSCAKAVSGYKPTGHSIAQIHAALEEQGHVVALETVTQCYNKHVAALSDHGVELDIEFSLDSLHRKLDILEREFQLDEKYSVLKRASPMAVEEVTGSGALLRALYKEGERIIVHDHSFDEPPLMIWKHDTKDEDLLGSQWYLPLPVSGRRTRKKAGGPLVHLAPPTVMRWHYAVATPKSQDISKLIPEIISGAIRTHVVLSPKGFEVQMVFSVAALSKEHWHEQCRELRKRLAELDVVIPNFRYDWLSRLPSPSSPCRLLYLSP